MCQGNTDEVSGPKVLTQELEKTDIGPDAVPLPALQEDADPIPGYGPKDTIVWIHCKEDPKT